MITIKNIIGLLMNKLRSFIVNIFLFFGLIKDHEFTTEEILENKQNRRGEIISIIKDKKDDSRK